jgi:hypothetical protein
VTRWFLWKIGPKFCPTMPGWPDELAKKSPNQFLQNYYLSFFLGEKIAKYGKYIVWLFICWHFSRQFHCSKLPSLLSWPPKPLCLKVKPLLFLGSVWSLYILLYCSHWVSIVLDLLLSTSNKGYCSCPLAIISTQNLDNFCHFQKNWQK